MKTSRNMSKALRNESGASIILVAVMLLMLLGFTALATETGRIVVIRGELQNAADAGALAGARYLYNADGTALNLNAIQIASDAAKANTSEKDGSGKPLPVEVNLPGDVQIGHWSLNNREFTPYAGDLSVYVPARDCSLWRPRDEIDNDTNCINAVRVVTRREGTPPVSIFARIWDQFKNNLFPVRAAAIAYLGYSGSFAVEDVDMPLAICQEAILEEDGSPTCATGRMINSGQDVGTHNSGGWTSFNQGLDEEGNVVDNVCQGGTSANELKNLINPPPGKPPGSETCVGHPASGTVEIGQAVATLGGEAESAFKAVRKCWVAATDTNNDGIPDIPWGLKLPVIACPENNVGTCAIVKGTVTVEVLWITREGENSCQYESTTVDPDTGETITVYNYPPLKMGDWECSDQDITSQADFDFCWNSFVNYEGHQLKNLTEDEDGNLVLVPAPCQKKAIYFKPNCDVTIPEGDTGGPNFGMIARIPVLVD